MDLPSWTLGLSLIVLTIAIHTTGVVMLAFGLQRRIRVGADRHLHDPRRAIPVVIGHIGAVALILAALHGLGSTLWASAYQWLDAFGSFTEASLYSLGTMTTFEIPGLVLPTRLRMLGALEAVNGVLLFGISTAFIFAVMQAYWLTLSRRAGVQTDGSRSAVDRVENGQGLLIGFGSDAQLVPERMVEPEVDEQQ